MEFKGAVDAIKAIDTIAKDYEFQIKAIIFKNSHLLETYTRQLMQGGTTSTHLRKRSGRLQGSTKAIVVKKTADGVYTGGIQVGTTYAGIHIARPGQEGGSTVIRPKNKKFLTIPLPAALTPAGVLRGSAMSGLYHNTFIQRSKAGNLIIFGAMKQVQFAGQKQKIVPLFLLVKKVTVPFRINASSLLNWIKPKMESDIESIKIGGLKPI